MNVWSYGVVVTLLFVGQKSRVQFSLRPRFISLMVEHCYDTANERVRFPYEVYI